MSYSLVEDIPFPSSSPQTLVRAEQERDREWERRRVSEARAGLVLETQLKKSRKELERKLAEENRQLAAEQRAK